MSDTSSFELFGHPERQPDFDEPEPAPAPMTGPLGWIILEDRPAAAQFSSDHKHGEIVHARTWDGHHVLACEECGGGLFVDVPISNEQFARLPAWPFPKAGRPDLAATVAALTDRVTRLERA